MTVQQLRDALGALPTTYWNAHVVLSRDAGGNDFAALRKLGGGRYEPASGAVVLQEWEEEWAELDKPANAIVLFP